MRPAVMAIRRRSERKYGTRSSGIEASCGGSAAGAGRPFAARGMGRATAGVGRAVGATAGTSARAGSTGGTTGREADGVLVDGRPPRCGFFGWGRLFFLAMGACLRGKEFSAKVDKRLTGPTGCVKNPRGYNI